MQRQVSADDKTDQEYQSKKTVNIGICDEEVDAFTPTPLLAERLEYSLADPQH
jgi:hypothetical protein